MAAFTYGEPRRRVSWHGGRQVAQRRSILIRDINREPDQQAGAPHIRAELAIPIRADGGALLVVLERQPVLTRAKSPSPSDS